jgi:hypothetical protein
MDAGTFQPKQVRYIKLGPGGSLTAQAIAEGTMPALYREVPHAMCVAGDWSGAAAIYQGRGLNAGSATRLVNELRDFYTLGADCLWLTFHARRLWWGFADEAVSSDSATPTAGSVRMRRILGGWRCRDLRGAELGVDRLSSRLTKVAGFRGTICRIADEAYLLNLLRGEPDQRVTAARIAHGQLVEAVERLLPTLDQADFETLVDLIFARSGWERISSLGGVQPDVDLVVRERFTGRMAAVQVKSRANAEVLANYAARLAHDTAFLVCHTPEGDLSRANRPDLTLWVGSDVAERVVDTGLVSWLIEHAG